MEINKEQSLGGNSLDDLDNESSNPDHAEEQPPKKQESGFDNGEQHIIIPRVDAHFSATTPERACELAMWLHNQIQSISNKGGYIN